MKRFNTFAKLGVATTMAFGTVAPIAAMMVPVYAQEAEPEIGMWDTHNIQNLAIDLVEDLKYTGAPQEQNIKFMINNVDQNLVKDVDYTVEGNVETEVGRYTMTVKGIGNYHGEAQVNFIIEPNEEQIDGMWDTHNIENLVIDLVENLKYTGAPQEQNIKFTIDGEDQNLVKDVDYTVEGNVETEIGRYTMTVRGIGDYHGEVLVNYIIEAASKPIDGMWDTHNIKNLTISLANQLVENGTSQDQKIVIAYQDLILEEGIDYVLSNNRVTNAGSYTLTATGINDYHGSVQVNFNVQQAAKTDIRNAKVTLVNALKANGKNQTQNVRITYGNLILEEGIDYTLENNVAKDAGTYTMKIKAMGDLFTGETSVKYTIAPSNKKEDVHTGVSTGIAATFGTMVLAAIAGIGCVFARKNTKAK